MLKQEVIERKKHITMLISVYVVSKVLIIDLFNNPEAIKKHFGDVPKRETVYFTYYGMTLLTLLTDLLYKRFGALLAAQSFGKKEAEIKQEIF